MARTDNTSRQKRTSALGRASGRAGRKPSAGRASARSSAGRASARPSAGRASARPSAGRASARPSAGRASARPSSGRAFAEARDSRFSAPRVPRAPFASRASREERVKRTRFAFEEVRSQLEDREVKTVSRKPKIEVYTPKPRKPKAAGEVGIRLNRFIANSGLCSRREADEYILEGLVSVNGVVVTELGTKVFQNDEVRFDDKVIRGEEKVYIIMNKPKNCVTTTDDPQNRKTVLDLVAGKCPQRVYPVGRLDRDTTGVLLLTNDGELTEKLTHPSYNKKKIYQVSLDANLKQSDFDKILKGIYLDDGLINADALSYVDGDQTQVGIEIHSGRNRIVRRIFESLGYKVIKLDRVYFAGLTKKNLRRGQWRFLTDKELAILKMGSYE